MIQTTAFHPEVHVDFFDDDDDDDDDDDFALYNDDISQFDDESVDVPNSPLIQSKFSALANKSCSVSQKLSRSVLEPPTFADEVNGENTIHLNKYFGTAARQDFSRRLNWVSRHKNVELEFQDEALVRTRLDTEKQSALAFPFCPVRIDHLFDSDSDERYAADVLDEASTASTFDASAVMHDADEGCISSPRTKYIGRCIQKKVNPRMSLILRKRVTDEISLQHMGMGDALGELFAESIKDLPLVRSINLTDNNLTDTSLRPIIDAITELADLTSLDLSSNCIDRQTSHALALYLHNEKCPLKKLTLKNADVDDLECALFVEALLGNTTLEDLSLSRNIVGKSENLNSVKPDLITGGEALGALLTSNSCQLQSLDVSWNLIRMDGASALASSLATNSFLTHLDMSYNGLGRAAGEVLGHSLLKNQSLKSLHLANNSINHSACFTICVAMEESLTLRSVVLDGNPIGEGGGRMLMQIPLMIGNRVKVSATGCNFVLKDADSKFNMTQPEGFYELDMQRPYERAIAFKLLRLIANHPTYVFSSFSFLAPNQKAEYSSQPPPKTSSLFKKATYNIPRNARKVKLVKVATRMSLQSLDDEGRQMIESLRNMEKSASDVVLATELFQRFDEDGSGALDREELYKLIIDVGLRLDLAEFEQAVDMVDIDGSGVLELDEFFDFLKGQKKEAMGRIADILDKKMMVQPASREVPYVPPRKGVLYIAVADSYRSSGNKVLSSLDYTNMMSVVDKGVDNVSAVIHYGIQCVQLRLKEALEICDALCRLEGDTVKMMARILPQMISPLEARSLIMNIINFDRVALKRLELVLGNSFNPIIGIFNGYYSLDLSVETDRICLAKLLVQSQRHADYCVKRCAFQMGTTGDVSQVGDWSAFRNEYVNGLPTRIDTDLFNPMPKMGKVSFDFSGEDKVPLDSPVMKDARCVNIVLNMSLVDRKFKGLLISELSQMKQVSQHNLSGQGTFIPICDACRAEDIQLCMLKFYSRLSKRAAQHAQVLELEGDVHQPGAKAKERVAEKNDSADESDSDSLSHFVFDEQDEESPVTVLSDRLIEATSTSRSVAQSDDAIASGAGRRGGVATSRNDGRGIVEDENLRAGVIPPAGDVVGEGPTSPDVQSPAQGRKKKTDATDNALKITNAKMMMCQGSQAVLDLRNSRGVNYNAKCCKIMSVVVDMMSRVVIRSRHLALIVKWFHLGRSNRTRHFGTYRVDLIVLLFGRVIDLHHFDLVLSVLTSFEVACLYCRLGILNIFNPLKPEGCICLNISNREERIVAKILALLSVIEPGANWIAASFRWEYDNIPMPGWELTQSWMTQEGMPVKGFLFVNYGTNEGCRADVAARMGFLCMVRSTEEDIMADENNESSDGHVIHREVVGKKFCRSRSSIFHEYLAPVSSTSARVAQGETFLEIFGSYHSVFNQEGLLTTAAKVPPLSISSKSPGKSAKTGKKKAKQKGSKKKKKAK